MLYTYIQHIYDILFANSSRALIEEIFMVLLEPFFKVYVYALVQGVDKIMETPDFVIIIICNI